MKFRLLTLILAGSIFASAQTTSMLPEQVLSKEEIRAQLMYIASDEMAGRRTASKGAEMAAEYIVAQFELVGVQKVPGQNSWFQKIPFNLITPPVSTTLKIEDSVFKAGDNLVVVSGDKKSFTAEAVFVNYGWQDAEKNIDDYKGLDVKGKLVFALPGNPDSKGPMDLFNSIGKKREIAIGQGAIGLVELYRVNFPWRFFRSYFEKERLEVVSIETEESQNFYHAWIMEGVPNPVIGIEKGEIVRVGIQHSGNLTERLFSSNVIGYIPGSDPKLRDEFILLSAHYDHVGVGKEGGAAFTAEDSIFNGARDNGIGTVAVLSAAKVLAKSAPKRSVILLACTGEEMGMLGSAYYVKNPWVPLEKTVFNFNTDGAGYNTTKHISVVGWGRTNSDEIMKQAAELYGLGVIPNPVPNQNLYERSDNISFARAGIPAVNFSPGVTSMDDEIMKYYHKASDNPETIDYDYVFQLCRAYATAALGLANASKLSWMPGDVYEKK